jgi:hypothetical protein
MKHFLHRSACAHTLVHGPICCKAAASDHSGFAEFLYLQNAHKSRNSLSTYLLALNHTRILLIASLGCDMRLNMPL